MSRTRVTLTSWDSTSRVTRRSEASRLQNEGRLPMLSEHDLDTLWHVVSSEGTPEERDTARASALGRMVDRNPKQVIERLLMILSAPKGS